MPDEALITEIENILTEVIQLGGENERTEIVSNLTVQDANPAGLDGFIIVTDSRDGDNILAKKVSSVTYSDNDLVNVLFSRGTEPIAFQQGSESPSGDLWEIVPSTSTDIYYNKGDVGIGKSVAPDAALEILDTSQAQLRLTFEEDVKFTTFTIDTNHHLTIDPSSTGQIKLASADVTIEEDFVHEGDPDTVITFTDDKISFDAGGLNLLALTETAQDLVEIGDVAGGGDVDINFSAGQMFLRGSDNFLGVNITSPSTAFASMEVATTGNKAITSSSYSTTTTFAGEPTLNLLKSHNASIGTLTETLNGERLGSLGVLGVDSNDVVRSTAGFRVTQAGAAGAGDVPSHFDLIASNNVVVMRLDDSQDVVIANGNTPSPLGQLHVDQDSSVGAQPVLYLDQADVSEEMMQFETTIGVGNAIEAVGAKTLTTTHFIKVTLPGSLTRYIPVGTIA